MTKNIAKIAIIKPLHNLFDYEIHKDMKTIKPGSRVCVEFGKKHVFGIVIKIIVKNKPLSPSCGGVYLSKGDACQVCGKVKD